MSIVLQLKLAGSKRILRGQAHYWSVMRELREFTISDIEERSNVDRADIRKFVRGLLSGSYIKVVGAQPMKPGRVETTYRIERNQAACPRLSKTYVQSTGQQNIWNVLRGPMGRDGINARDLAAFAATDDVPVPIDTARGYLRLLAQAGYLVPLKKGGPGRLTVWRLKSSMNTGPLPPMILRSKMVYDQNANTMMGDVIAEEDRT